MNFHQTLIAPQRLILICNQMGVYKTDPSFNDEQTPAVEQPIMTMDNFQCWLSPNPVNTITTLFLNTPLTEEATITLTDVQGRTVLRENINANMAYKHINFSALPSGVYVLTINDTYAKLKIVKDE